LPRWRKRLSFETGEVYDMPFKDWKRPGDQPQEQSPGMQTPQGNVQQQPGQQKQPTASHEQNLQKKKHQPPKQPGT
jgi:hypothetical protein